MTTHEPTPDRMLPDAILERLADGEATSADWAAFHSAAAAEPSLWQDLAQAQRCHAEFCAEVQAVTAVVDRVEAPADLHMTEGLTRRIRIVGSFGGWAAAAAVLLAWSAGLTPWSGAGRKAGLIDVPTPTPEQAFQTYLDTGKQTGLVVDEVPGKLMVETRRTPGGQIEVIYLRQVMERTVLPRLYRTGVDEAGQMRMVPIEVEKPG